MPLWAFDITSFSDLKAKLLKDNEGCEFVDLRSAMQSIPGEDASIGGEGRALLDWNKRNVVSWRARLLSCLLLKSSLTSLAFITVLHCLLSSPPLRLGGVEESLRARRGPRCRT